MKIRLMFLLFALFWLNIQGQEFSVDVSPQSIKCLPGVPDNIGVTITNVSGKDIWIAGKSLKDGVSIGLPSLTNEKGEDFSCISPSDQSMIVSSLDAPIGNKVLFRKGESWSVSSGSFGEEFCPMTMDLTSVRKVKFVLTVKVAEGPLVKDIRRVKIVGEVAIDFLKPEGEDLAYIKAVQDWLSKADPKEINGFTEQVKPLTWGELLSSFRRIPTKKILHDKFPTSTYAGYALLPPNGQSIPDSRVFLTNLLCNEETAQRWPETAKQMAAEKKKALEDDEKRVEQLTSYLKARPDFAKADALKVEIAGRLAALGRYNEAQTVCEEITSHDANSVEAGKATMLMEFLVKKGHLKETRPFSIPVPASEKKTTGSTK